MFSVLQFPILSIDRRFFCFYATSVTGKRRIPPDSNCQAVKSGGQFFRGTRWKYRSGKSLHERRILFLMAELIVKHKYLHFCLHVLLRAFSEVRHLAARKRERDQVELPPD